MKFFCEYCGSRIDAEVDDKCPHCGASYKKNKKFIKLHEEKIKQDEQNNAFKQQVMNHTLGAMKFSRWFVFIPIILFVIVFSIIVFSAIRMEKKTNSKLDNIDSSVKDEYNEVKDNIDSVIDSMLGEINKQEEEQSKITVNINEYGATKEYQVKVTGYEKVEDTFNTAEAGYELVKFHLVVGNLTNERLTKEDVNCIVDGVAQKNYYSSGYSDLPMFISSDLTVKGDSTFIVPQNASSYDIRYGDYITIHIEK